MQKGKVSRTSSSYDYYIPFISKFEGKRFTSYKQEKVKESFKLVLKAGNKEKKGEGLITPSYGTCHVLLQSII